MGMGFAPTWLRRVSPPPLHKTTLTTERALAELGGVMAAVTGAIPWTEYRPQRRQRELTAVRILAGVLSQVSQAER